MRARVMSGARRSNSSSFSSPIRAWSPAYARGRRSARAARRRARSGVTSGSISLAWRRSPACGQCSCPRRVRVQRQTLRDLLREPADSRGAGLIVDVPLDRAQVVSLILVVAAISWSSIPSDTRMRRSTSPSKMPFSGRARRRGPAPPRAGARASAARAALRKVALAPQRHGDGRRRGTRRHGRARVGVAQAASYSRRRRASESTAYASSMRRRIAAHSSAENTGVGRRRRRRVGRARDAVGALDLLRRSFGGASSNS